jgi:hypothetical protein
VLVGTPAARANWLIVCRTGIVLLQLVCKQSGYAPFRWAAKKRQIRLDLALGCKVDNTVVQWKGKEIRPDRMGTKAVRDAGYDAQVKK